MAASETALGGETAKADWRRWLKFLLFVLVAGWAAYAVTISAYVQLIRKPLPDRALALDPGNADALNQKLIKLISERGLEKPTTRAEMERLSRRSVEAQLLNPRPLATLATITDLNKQRDRAAPMFDAVSKMTRREHFTELWLAIYHEEKGRFSRALTHYDRLLRIEPQTAQALHPILAAAISQPGKAAAFRPLFAAPPEWFVPFLRYALTQPTAVAPIADAMIRPGSMPDAPIYRAVRAETLGALVQSGDFTRASRLLAAAGKDGAVLATTADFRTATRNSDYGAFAWRLGSDDGVSGDFEEGASAAAPMRFRMLVSALRSGVALTKAVALPPGRYRITLAYEPVAATSKATASWRLRCVGGPTLLVVPLPLGGARGAVRSDFAVATGCPIQMLELLGNGGERYPGVELLVSGPVVAVNRDPAAGAAAKPDQDAADGTA